METINDTVVPEHYNPHQLVTYKVIDGENVSYPTSKVTDVEYALEQGRYWRKQWDVISGNVARLQNDLEQYLEMDAEEIVAAICEIFGFNPTKEIEFTGSLVFSGRIEVPLNELEDFDLESELSDLYIDINNGNVVIDSYDIDSIENQTF